MFIKRKCSNFKYKSAKLALKKKNCAVVIDKPAVKESVVDTKEETLGNDFSEVSGNKKSRKKNNLDNKNEE